MTLFAMNIYRRIFVRDEISTGEYLSKLTCSGLIFCTQEYSRQTPCSCTAALKRKSFYIQACSKMLQFSDFDLQGLNISWMLNIMENSMNEEEASSHFTFSQNIIDPK